MDYLCDCAKTVSIKAVITERGKLLVVSTSHHNHSHWDLPGGRMACSEDIFDTLKREIKEELGISRFSFEKRPRFVFSWYNKKVKTHGIVIGFPVKLSSYKFKAADKNVKEIHWVRFKDIKKLDIAGLLKPHYVRIFAST